MYTRQAKFSSLHQIQNYSLLALESQSTEIPVPFKKFIMAHHKVTGHRGHPSIKFRQHSDPQARIFQTYRPIPV